MPWPPLKEKAGYGAGVENNQKRSAQIITLPAGIRNCTRCGGHYRPAHRDGGICPDCHGWYDLASHTAAAAAALRRVRR